MSANDEASRRQALRESVKFETRSDLYAFAGDLRGATELMEQANAIRRRIFGKLKPEQLRARTLEALQPLGPTIVAHLTLHPEATDGQPNAWKLDVYAGEEPVLAIFRDTADTAQACCEKLCRVVSEMKALDNRPEAGA